MHWRVLTLLVANRCSALAIASSGPWIATGECNTGTFHKSHLKTACIYKRKQNVTKAATAGTCQLHTWIIASAPNYQPEALAKNGRSQLALANLQAHQVAGCANISRQQLAVVEQKRGGHCCWS